MKSSYLIAAAFAASFVAMDAFTAEEPVGTPEAAKPRPRNERLIKLFDKDGDGKLNEAERVAAGEAFVRRFDKDGDGKLNEAERKEAFAKRPPRNVPKAANANCKCADGVKCEECAKCPDCNGAKLCAKCAAKKAGAKPAVQKPAATKGGAKPANRRAGAEQGGARRAQPPAAVVKAFDKDGDGKLNAAERKELATTRRSFDKDGDGKLDEAERKAFRASIIK